MQGFKYTFVCVLCFACFSLKAIPVDSLKYLKDKLKTYTAENPSSDLYLHLDKNIYAQNDNIWFKAYLLASGNLDKKNTDSKVLYVRLVDRDKKLIVKAQFPMYDIRANGNLEIPETVKDGDYMLYAFTDKMINFSEQDVFVQHITIKREEVKPLEAEASVVDTTKLRRGEKVQVVVKVKNGGILAEGVKGNYELRDGTSVLKAGMATTNLFGEAYIDFTYPQLADDKILQFKIVFKRNSDFAELLLNLKHEGNTININVHPEGGVFIAGVPVKTVLYATDVNSNPVSITADMTDGNKTIARFTTDKYGLASINITPAANTTYKFNYTISGARKSVTMNYPINNKGYTVSVTKTKGTTSAMVKNIGEQTDALVLVRAMDQVMGSQRVKIQSGDSLAIPLPQDQLPGEILSVGIFDTLGTPLAERLYSNTKPDNYKVKLTTDAKIYSNHQKVTLTVDISDSVGRPVTGNFSVAVIEKNSIDHSKYLTINHYWDYKAVQGDLVPFLTAGTANNIDHLLITRNWRNNWNVVRKYEPGSHPGLIENSGGVTGTVYLNSWIKKTDKEIAQILDTTRLLLRSNMGYAPVKIRPDHTFSIPPGVLLTTQYDELALFKWTPFRENFHIVIDIPERIFEVKVKDSPILFTPLIFNILAFNKPAQNPSPFKKVVALKQVNIHAGANKGENFQTGECYDYVCINGGLDCRNHQPGMPGSELNTKPVPGQTYIYLGGGKIVYYGCGDYMFKSVTAPKVFNAPDYGKEQYPEPVFGTTIFWQPNVYTPPTGSNTVSFYTSDLSGDFTVVMQGIDTKTLKPIYATTNFTVK